LISRPIAISTLADLSLKESTFGDFSQCTICNGTHERALDRAMGPLQTFSRYPPLAARLARGKAEQVGKNPAHRLSRARIGFAFLAYR